MTAEIIDGRALARQVIAQVTADLAKAPRRPGLAVILGSVSGAGLPGAAVIYAIYGPGLQVLGAPLAIIPLYLAVIALPDPVITGTSVTGNLTAAALVNRLMGAQPAKEQRA